MHIPWVFYKILSENSYSCMLPTISRIYDKLSTIFQFLMVQGMTPIQYKLNQSFILLSNILMDEIFVYHTVVYATYVDIYK